MRIGFYLSSKGGSPLQVGLERGLTRLGHRVENCNPNEQYDLVLVFNQCAHDPTYRYPEFPKHADKLAFVDSAEYGYFKRLPAVVGNYWNTFAEGAINHDTKNKGQQEFLRRQLEGRSFPYFMREFSKHVEFPSGYYPIDYPLYLHSECRQKPEFEEYARRPLDLFVYWGGSHPWRLQLTEALRACHTKCEITIIDDVHAPRLPQKIFFAKTRMAKCSVSFDGYGSGSFRMTEVLCRCLLLQGPLSIYTREPLVDGVHCVEYGIKSDGEQFLETDIKEKLIDAIADVRGSFSRYEAGYNHCLSKYTERATAECVMKTIDGHDWSTPTKL